MMILLLMCYIPNHNAVWHGPHRNYPRLKGPRRKNTALLSFKEIDFGSALRSVADTEDIFLSEKMQEILNNFQISRHVMQYG